MGKRGMDDLCELEGLVRELSNTKAEWTGRAQAIGKRGFERFPPRGIDEKIERELLVQVEYFNLSKPAFEVVKWLQHHDLLDILAEHAELKANLGADFPYLIPVVPQVENSHQNWDPESAIGKPQFIVDARLLLWFAVAHDPKAAGIQIGSSI